MRLEVAESRRGARRYRSYYGSLRHRYSDFDTQHMPSEGSAVNRKLITQNKEKYRMPPIASTLAGHFLYGTGGCVTLGLSELI